jgi:Oligosaccharide biosynthesis protein Alg14 like
VWQVVGWKNVRIVFVESFCRAKTLSLTGHFLYHISDEFLVQWPLLAERYPLVRYIGRLVWLAVVQFTRNAQMWPFPALFSLVLSYHAYLTSSIVLAAMHWQRYDSFRVEQRDEQLVHWSMTTNFQGRLRLSANCADDRWQRQAVIMCIMISLSSPCKRTNHMIRSSAFDCSGQLMVSKSNGLTFFFLVNEQNHLI